ncbi:MAG: ATP-binding protein [Candidatus Nanoarchaeia archaeon]|nr:ATP-binding protein [Candidatus Nanoarchaeia archaeon]
MAHLTDFFIENVSKDFFKKIIGQKQAKDQIKSALIVGRNIILEGPPGIGKTTLVKSIANALPQKEVNDCPFHCNPENPSCPYCLEKIKNKEKIPTKKLKGEDLITRVQGSPDLTIEDLFGDIDPQIAMKKGAYSIEAFRPGKIFKANGGILFFDEVNRTSEKLQNALLQALEEKIITLSTYTIDFNIDFILIATMNPEDYSTERLSDVFLDRFDVIKMTYPETVEIEKEILKDVEKNNALSSKNIIFPDNLVELFLDFIFYLRKDENLEKKPSVRSSIGIYERSLAFAYMDNCFEVEMKHLKLAMQSVLNHRLRLKPSVEFKTNVKDYIDNEFNKHLNKNKLKNSDSP